MSTAGWSDDRITLLRTLWLGGLTAAQVAAALGGVTRNAVIGKVHRLGLSGHGVPSAPGSAPFCKSARPVRKTRDSPLPASRPFGPEGSGLVADIAQLGVHACRWPIGDPKAPDFSFCGRFAEGRYCGTHQAMGVRRGTVWRADRDPTLRRALAGLI